VVGVALLTVLVHHPVHTLLVLEDVVYDGNTTGRVHDNLFKVILVAKTLILSIGTDRVCRLAQTIKTAFP